MAEWFLRRTIGQLQSAQTPLNPCNADWIRRATLINPVPTIVSALLLLLTLCTVAPDGYAVQDNKDGLMDLSLDQLMELEVTSVSKKPEKLSDAAAAVFVITSDDIRHSGATTLPEILRMVPGLQVARIDGNRWAISARGFNGAFANKLLVLVDGRSVYTPTFSGVYWDVQDVALQDVDRIEVIRGPGATLWGVNAVNGVINIISKSAGATQGVHIESGGGSGDVSYFGTVRYGGQFNEQIAWRVSGKSQGFGESGKLWRGVGGGALNPTSTMLSDAQDEWDMNRINIRGDASLSPADRLTVQSEVYDGTIGTAYVLPEIVPPYANVTFDKTQVSGGNLLGNFTHAFNDDASQLRVQFYYDRTKRIDVLYGETVNTFDVDVQQSLSPATWLSILGGGEYRYVDLERVETAYLSGGSGPTTTLRFFSGFLQSEFSLLNDHLDLTVGAKVEDTEYSGAEVQPNVRVAAQVARRHTIWASLSRAARTPSAQENSGRIWLYAIPPFTSGNETPMTLVAETRGSSDYQSEIVTSAEAGYRTLLTSSLSLDIAAFRNSYSDLVVNILGIPEITSESIITQPLEFINGLSGTTMGVEIATDWQPVSQLRFKGGYTYLDMDLDIATDAMILDEVHTQANGHVPRHQVSVRTQIDVHRDVGLDLWMRSVGELASLKMPSYTELDLRAEWRPARGVAVAAVGRNLLHDKHQEFSSELTGLSTEIKRSGYLSVILDF